MMTSTVREFDLRPTPRILPMLGEITLPQWRCVAELVDNSVDGFLAARRDGEDVTGAQVHINLPLADAPAAKISVRDNGPGMTLDVLENAVRAGWTGNDPVNNLGMFGMGFNIATARLGTLTTVWTTKKRELEWIGLQIDFERLLRQRHFRTPLLTRPKLDPFESGTEVTVERLKPEQRQFFAKAGNRSKVSRELSRTYSAMLRPNGVPLGFHLYLNGTTVRGRNHCIWGGDGNPSREVSTSRFGIVNAFQPISVQLPNRPFCAACWQWLPPQQENCPMCDAHDDVMVRTRGVRGWVGLQRYLHDSEYGIDLLRNGRKIELASKDLFNWSDGETVDPEYPIDDPRHRGRIVGEIHIDHCRVNYTKDRFDRNDPAWEEMVRILRGDGPLRPDKAADLGYGQNNAPLFLLFQAFRRSSPKPKVAGCYAKLLVVKSNEQAEEMGKKYYEGVGEYLPDLKWYELIEEEDRKLLTTSLEHAGETDDSLVDDITGSPTPPEGGPAPVLSSGVTRVPIPSLTREFLSEDTGLRWDVISSAVDSLDPLLRNNEPWKFRYNSSGEFDFFVNLSHGIFRSATMTPLDALLSELASQAMDSQRGLQNVQPFSAVLAGLRARYTGDTKLDPESLAGEARITLSAIAKSLSRNIQPDDSLAIFRELLSTEQEATLAKMATITVGNPQKAINDGRFLQFAPRQTILTVFERFPELFLDGRYWDTAFATIDYGTQTEAAKTQIVRYFIGLLADAIWLAEQDPADLAEFSRARLLRASLALDLLSPAHENEV
jgi:hypothetical protein